MNWTKSEWYKNLCLFVSFVFLFETFQPMTYGLPQPKIGIDFGVSEASAQGSEWLVSTVDANYEDPFIQAKLAEIGQGVDAAFAFVRDQISYESYRGSLRGAKGTLWSKAGNSLDKASLLIALLRAQGIPARYAKGTLPEDLAKELILSMFTTPCTVTGIVPEGVQVSDPANDPQLLSETIEHYWVEYDPGSGFMAADPMFAEAQLGQDFANVEETFAEIPDPLRHKVRIRLKAEIVGALTGFAGGGPEMKIPLDRTFNTVELPGKPLSIGHFVNVYSPPSMIFSYKTYTYSPYILFGQSDGDISDDPIIRGDDYQEFMTNFPLASQIVTGVFLEVDEIAPDGSIHTYQKTLVDRIGYAARRQGGNATLDIDTSGPAPINDLDVVTLSLSVGSENSKANANRMSVIARLAEEYKALLTDNDLNLSVPNDAQLLKERLNVLRKAFTEINILLATQFTVESDISLHDLEQNYLVYAYYDSPRIIISGHQSELKDEQPVLRNFIDVWKSEVRIIPNPGQASNVRYLFNMVRGVTENVIETFIMEKIAAPNNQTVSTVRIFSQAQQEGISFRLIGNAFDIESLDLSNEAKARISAAVSSEKLIIVPSRSILIEGAERTAWFEIDAKTGQTYGVTEDGRHGSLTEWSYINVVTAFIAVPFISFVTGYVSGAIFAYTYLLLDIVPDQLFDRSDLKEVMDNISNALSDNWYIGNLATAPLAASQTALITNILSLSGGPAVVAGALAGGAFVAGFAVALKQVAAHDPPLPNFMIGANDCETFPPGAEPGVSVEINPDTLITVPCRGTQVPSAFRVVIKNLGPTADIFDLTFPNPPAGFTILSSLSSVIVPAGTSAGIGVYLQPVGNIPLPGTTISFSADVASQTNPSVKSSIDEEFIAPEIHGLGLTADPIELSTSHGVAASTNITITSQSNVQEEITLTLDLPSGLTQEGLVTPVNIGVGGSNIQTLTLTPDADIPVNTTLLGRIIATFGSSASPQTQSLELKVHIVVPGVITAANASNAASRLGRNELSSSLEALSRDLNTLYLDASSEVYKSRALVEIQSLITQLDDPLLEAFITDFQASIDTISASTPDDLEASLNALGAVLGNFEARLSNLASHNFEVHLDPNSATPLPATPANFAVQIRNTGSQTTTYHLSLSTLPDGITGSVTPASITLTPGEQTGCFGCQSVTATVTEPTDKLTAFNFEVTATAESAPDIVRKASGALTLRNELVQIASVPASPPFTDPGGSVAVSARILNAVNEDRDALAGFTVKNGAGDTVFTSTPVLIPLTVLSSLDTFSLGAFDTTGYELGRYTLTVVATESNGTEIPGAVGEGFVLIGSPVAANLAITPETIPSGGGTVSSSLEIESLVDYSNQGIELMGLVDTDGSARSVAIYGNYAYVGGTTNISIVDISDPLNPKIIGSFGGEIGNEFIKCLVKDDRLYIAAGNTLYVYSLSDPITPELLGSYNGGYNYLMGAFIQEDHLYTSTGLIAYYTSSSQIVCVGGNFLSYDVSDPAQPYRAWALSTGSSCYGAGWDHIVYEGVPVNEQIAYVPTTTATGSNTTGVGKLLIMDISNPNSPSISGELEVPGASYLVGVAVDGDTALVVGSTTGYRNPGTPDFDPTGNMTLTTLDISVPESPVIIATIDTGLRAYVAAGPSAAGNGYFALNGYDSNVIVVDTADPAHPTLITETAPSRILEVRTKGNLLYTVSDSGLGIYDIGSIVGTYVTTSVEAPHDESINIIADSFNVPPDRIITESGKDTLVWSHLLSASQPKQTFTWDATVAQEGSLSISPETRSIRPGEETLFTATLTNETDAPAVYNLAVVGLPQSWAALEPSVTVPAHDSLELPLTIKSDTFSAKQESAFTVTAFRQAESETVVLRGSVDFVARGAPGRIELPEKRVFIEADAEGKLFASGTLVIDGLPLLSNEAHGVFASLTPAQASTGRGGKADFVVRLTNTGNVVETFSLSTTGLPSGFVAAIGEDAPEISPGVDNYRETTLSISVPMDADPGDFPFTLTAASKTNSTVVGTAAGSLKVLPYGVDVSITPSSGPPGTAFSMTVTNTGQASDVFDLSLGGPAAIVAQLASSSLSLEPGASQTVAISVGEIGFAFEGSLELAAIAASQSDPSAKDTAAAALSIGATRGVAASFTPDSSDIKAPGSASFLLLVQNTGNGEDAYSAAITGVTGSVEASLSDLNGEPTTTIPLFRLPGLSTAAILLDGTILSGREGTITVTVTSTEDSSIQASATVVFDSANEPPIARAGENRSVPLGDTVSFDGSASSDPDSGPSPLSYAWTFISRPQGSSLNDNAISGRLTAHASFVPDAPGTYDLLLTVSDGEASSADDVRITVLNNKPTADAGQDKNVLTGVSVFLDGSRSDDADKQPVSHRWSLLEKPAASALSDEDIHDKDMPDPSFTPDVDGEYRFQLIVSDGIEESVPDLVTVSAFTTNAPPNAVAGEGLNCLTGQMALLDGAKSNDPDNLPGPLTFQWSFKALPEGSALGDADLLDRDQVNPYFVPDVSGDFIVELTVSDGQNSDVDLTTVAVTENEAAPNANAGDDRILTLGGEILLDGTASNNPGQGSDTLVYQWRFVSIPPGSALQNTDIAGADSAAPRFTPDVEGGYVLALTISYNGAEDTDYVMVRASLGLRLIVDPRKGTIGTEFTMSGYDFGVKKGKLKIGGKKLKALAWSQQMVRVRLKKPNPPGAYDINIMPKKPKGGLQTVIVETDGFTVKAPEIQSAAAVEEAEGTYILKGKFFGTKKGKIYLGESACKVVTWAMDPTNGSSEATFRLPKAAQPGSYTVRLKNKMGTGRIGGLSVGQSAAAKAKKKR